VFTLPQPVVDAATAFDGYMKGAAAVGPGFRDDGAVRVGLKASAAYQPAQFEAGMIAYGAIVALRDPRFVAGVEAATGGQDAGRDVLAASLIADPALVGRIDGADDAADRIDAALSAEADPLVSAGAQVKAAAYSVQHQAWSKATAPGPAARLAEVKALSAAPAQPSDDASRAMLASISTAASAEEAPHPAFTPIGTRALALAAESILGEAESAERLAPLLVDADAAWCLKMAKLNLYQCMAVAGPEYEDIYCMGQHAMLDTGQCVEGARTGPAAAPAWSGAAVTPLSARYSLAPSSR
ncbi:MAG: hypothetical protein ACREEQ_09105, partial [Caulobacteraceae bacterium]